MTISTNRLNLYKSALQISIRDGITDDPYTFLEAVGYLSRYQEGRTAINSIPREKRRIIETKLLKDIPLSQEEQQLLIAFKRNLENTLDVILTLAEDNVDPEEKQRADVSRNTPEAISLLSKIGSIPTKQSWKRTKEQIINDWIHISKIDIDSFNKQKLMDSLNKLDNFQSVDVVFSYLDKEARSINVNYNRQTTLSDSQRTHSQRIVNQANDVSAVIDAVSDTIDYSANDIPKTYDSTLPLSLHGPSFPDMVMFAKAQSILNRDQNVKHKQQEKEKLALLAIESAKLTQSALPSSLQRNDPEIAALAFHSALEQKVGKLNETQLNKLIDINDTDAVRRGIGAMLFVDTLVAFQEGKTTDLARAFFDSSTFDRVQTLLKNQALDRNSAGLLGITQELLGVLTSTASVPEKNTFLPYIMGVYLSQTTGEKKSLLEQLLSSRALTSTGSINDKQALLFSATEDFIHASGVIRKDNTTAVVPMQFLLHFLLSSQKQFFKVTNQFFSFGNWLNSPAQSTQQKEVITSVFKNVGSVAGGGLSSARNNIVGFSRPGNLLSGATRLISPSPLGAVASLAKMAVFKNVWMWAGLAVLSIILAFILLPSVGDIQRDSLGESLQGARVGGYIESNSKYISVSKSVSTTSFPSNNAGVVTYTITISATVEPLSNVSIRDEFSVFSTSSSTAPESPTITVPTNIEPGSPFSTSYTMDLTTYKDALITNTLTVRADAVSQTQQESRARETVTIGTPPTSCFKFEPGWSAADRALEEQAIARMASEQPIFMKLLCAKGEIPLFRGGESKYGGFASNGTIRIYNLGLGSPNNAFYTLTHEAGHIFDFRNPEIKKQFTDTVPYVLPCTYGYIPGSVATEAFAEMIALYFATPPWKQCLQGSTFQARYPALWRFANEVIFN